MLIFIFIWDPLSSGMRGRVVFLRNGSSGFVIDRDCDSFRRGPLTCGFTFRTRGNRTQEADFPRICGEAQGGSSCAGVQILASIYQFRSVTVVDCFVCLGQWTGPSWPLCIPLLRPRQWGWLLLRLGLFDLAMHVDARLQLKDLLLETPSMEKNLRFRHERRSNQ